MKIRSVKAEFQTDGRMDRQTDVTKPVVAFRNFTAWGSAAADSMSRAAVTPTSRYEQRVMQLLVEKTRLFPMSSTSNTV